MHGQLGQRSAAGAGRVHHRLAYAIGATLMLAAMGAQPVAAAAPDNDSIRGAVAVGPLPFRHTVSTAEATRDDTDPDGCFGGRRSVWYTFRPAEDVTVLIAADAAFDATMEVFVGPRSALELLACADDPPALALRLEAGTAYRIRLASYGRAGGAATFTVDVYRPPTLALQVTGARVDERTGEVTVVGRLSCADAAGATIGAVTVRQRTPAGRIVVGSLFESRSLPCDGEPHRWHVLAVGRMAFGVGWARIVADAYACGIVECANTRSSVVTWLRSAR